MQVDSAICNWIQSLFITELANEKLKIRVGILIHSNAKFKG